MKIKITESQYRKIVNEVGGYDDHNIMAAHGGHIHGSLSRSILDTVGLIGTFTQHLESDEINKMNIMTATANLSNKFQQDINIINDLSEEIYLDDDFKELVMGYKSAMAKVLKYFRMLSGYSPGIMGGKPENLSYGLGMTMSDSELRVGIAKKIMSLGEYIERLGEMFNTILRRYQSRLDN